MIDPLCRSVSVNNAVLKTRASDHSIVIFETKIRLVSSNVMCSGEDHDPEKANSYNINPCQSRGRRARFEAMSRELTVSADTSSIIALQEFPRKEETGLTEFRNLLQAAFKTHRFFFGPIEDPAVHTESQLCMLVPEHLEATPIPSDDPRVQVLQIGEEAYLNIHPFHPSKYIQVQPDGTKVDTFQTSLLERCENIHTLGCHTIFIVGDWNRREADLLPPFKEHLFSPPLGSHYPPSEFLQDYLRRLKSRNPKGLTKPIDYLSVLTE